VPERPTKTLADLRAFYTDEYRPLYDRFTNIGAVAQELHTEIACGTDHLLFSLKPGDAVSPEDVERVAAHFKRATFDGFKLVYDKEVRKQYDVLMDKKYVDVHDGKFHGEITALWKQAKQIAACARNHETMSRRVDVKGWNAAFDEWKKILPLADEFTRLMASPEIVRSLKKSRNERILAFIFWFLTLIFGAFLGKLVNLNF